MEAQIPPGLFGIREDHIESYQSLDARFIKNKASTFFFDASGKAMEPLIYAGDILIVDRSIENAFGRVAVVSLHGELVCKRMLRAGSRVLLRSENSRYKDILVNQEMGMHVFGVVVAIARDIF